jgi:diacylglycerol kinase family enzyme
MGWGRFTRRAGLRAALAATVAAPLGRDAALTAAVVGAAQEQLAVGAVLGGLGAAARRAGRARASRFPTSMQVAVGAGVALATRAVWAVAPKEPAAVAPHRTWTGLDPSGDGAGIGLVVNPGAGAGRAGDGDVAGQLRAELPEATIVVLDDPASLADELERLAALNAPAAAPSSTAAASAAGPAGAPTAVGATAAAGAAGVAPDPAPGGEQLRAIGVAGGDGSINTAAGVALRHGLPLVVVPGGTLNHLARDLGPFLNTASLGSYVDIVDAREALEGRVGKWPALVVALARVLRRGSPVEVEIDGRPQRLWVAFVGNCRYRPDGMAPTWRERLDDGELDVRVADAGHPFSRIRLVLAVLTGRLHRSRVFRTWRTTGLRVRSADGPLRLARDGETFDGTEDFDIVKSGDRLAVYAPLSPGQIRR